VSVDMSGGDGYDGGDGDDGGDGYDGGDAGDESNADTGNLPIFTGAELEAVLGGSYPESHYAISEKYNESDNSYDGIEVLAVEYSSGNMTWEPLVEGSSFLKVSNSSVDFETFFNDYNYAPSGSFSVSSQNNEGNQGNEGYQGNEGNQGENINTNQTTTTAGNDKIQINMANSTSALSGLIDAAEGLDSLHLDGLSIFTDSTEDLNVDQNDSMITSQMSTNAYYFSENTNYAEISLGSGLSGEVHVWTQTPSHFYNSSSSFDTIIGIVDKTNNMIITENNDGSPSESFSSEINNLISSNRSTRESSDSYVSFSADPLTEYSVIVGDSAQNYSTHFGGVFDIYAVSQDTLILSEINEVETSGVLVDFTSGIQGNFQSAWVTSFGSTGGSSSFTIDNFEELRLTDFADYVIVTGDVGQGVGTMMHSATYFSTTQSGMIIDPGKSSGGIDKLDVNSDSSIYLSFLDSTDDSGSYNGVDVTINNDIAYVYGSQQLNLG